MSLGFVNTFILLLGVAGVMHEADDAYLIWSTWSCYWPDQFLTLHGFRQNFQHFTGFVF